MKISSKIIKGIKKVNLNGVIDMSELNAVKQQLQGLELNLDKNFRQYEYDPSHKVYIYVQNILSYFVEEFSGAKEFNDFCDIVVEIQDVYIPTGPPMSPLTASYFNFWCFFDLRFGKEKETIGSIFSDLIQEFNVDAMLLKALENLNRSYTGFYVHNGFDDDMLVLREIVTNKEYRCICPAGYNGKKGEVWFVRIVPNIDTVYDYNIVITTPYVMRKYNEKDWLKFFQRQSIEKNNINSAAKLVEFLKFHPDHKYWHDYVMDAYHSFAYDRICLTGIPDIKGSKPHELH